MLLLFIPDSTAIQVASITAGVNQETITNFMNSWWWIVLCFVMGFGGICMHILRRAIVTRGETTGAFKAYLKDNRNTIILSFGSYTIMSAIWFFNGLEMFGMEQFKLNMMTFFIGYNSQDIFDAYSAQKFNAGKAPIKEELKQAPTPIKEEIKQQETITEKNNEQNQI